MHNKRVSAVENDGLAIAFPPGARRGVGWYETGLGHGTDGLF